MDIQIDILDNSCSFTEGPLWHPEGFYLFSDIPCNTVYKIVPGKEKEIYLQPSGCTHNGLSDLSEQIGSNGLAWDNEGNLLLCQHGNGAVGVYANGDLQPLLDKQDGRPFNSPNDIVVHPDGTIFFSDPPYGLKDAKLNPSIRQDASAFYAWRNNTLTAFCTEYDYPNGLCLSPDNSTIYVCSNKPSERFILAYDTATLSRKGMVAAENSDGMKCDEAGNLWLCTKEGIIVIDDRGRRLKKIELPAIPANCCWGGRNKKELFITARQFVFLLRGELNIPGSRSYP